MLYVEELEIWMMTSFILTDLLSIMMVEPAGTITESDKASEHSGPPTSIIAEMLRLTHYERSV